MTEPDRRHWISVVIEEKRSLEAAQRFFKGRSLVYVLAALTFLIAPLFTFVLPGLGLSDMSLAALISVFLWLLYVTVVTSVTWKDVRGKLPKHGRTLKRIMTERPESLVRSRILAVAVMYLSGAVLIIDLVALRSWSIWFVIPLGALLVAVFASYRYMARHPGPFIDMLIEGVQDRPLLSFIFPLCVFAFLISVTLILIVQTASALQWDERFPILVGFLVVFGFVGIHFLTRWDDIVTKTSLNAAKIKEYDELARLIRLRRLKKQEEVEKEFNRIKDTHPDYTS